MDNILSGFKADEAKVEGIMFTKDNKIAVVFEANLPEHKIVLEECCRIFTITLFNTVDKKKIDFATCTERHEIGRIVEEFRSKY